MDPDENLRQQLQLAGAIIHLADEDYDATDDAVRLAELVQAMNDWIQRGGYIPFAWRNHPTLRGSPERPSQLGMSPPSPRKLPPPRPRKRAPRKLPPRGR